MSLNSMVIKSILTLLFSLMITPLLFANELALAQLYRGHNVQGALIIQSLDGIKCHDE